MVYVKKITKTYRRFNYHHEDLQNAITSIQEKKMSVYKASVHYKIPKSTLLKHIQSGKLPLQRRISPQPVLADEEDIRLRNWIIAKARLGFPMHPEEVKNAVQKIL